jgi:hypothetical protein
VLVSREEMTFDFGGARLSPTADRETLRWVLSQFLYGEVTGIQVGHWIYDAPDLEAARFLAKQAVQELQHVDNFLRILRMLELEPLPPHPVLRFLATDMMGEGWAEHVALEMATGEGFVLTAMYAMIDTLDHPQAVTILERASRQEETHVEFGEAQTMQLIADRPALRRQLLGLSLVWMWGVGRLAAYMERKLPTDHPVLGRLPEFLTHALSCSELRLQRMGLLDRPLAEVSAAQRSALIGGALARKGVGGLGDLAALPLRALPFGRKRRLTDTYLADPAVRAALSAVDA